MGRQTQPGQALPPTGGAAPPRFGEGGVGTELVCFRQLLLLGLPRGPRLSLGHLRGLPSLTQAMAGAVVSGNCRKVPPRGSPARGPRIHSCGEGRAPGSPRHAQAAPEMAAVGTALSRPSSEPTSDRLALTVLPSSPSRGGRAAGGRGEEAEAALSNLCNIPPKAADGGDACQAAAPGAGHGHSRSRAGFWRGLCQLPAPSFQAPHLPGAAGERSLVSQAEQFHGAWHPLAQNNSVVFSFQPNWVFFFFHYFS